MHFHAQYIYILKLSACKWHKLLILRQILDVPSVRGGGEIDFYYYRMYDSKSTIINWIENAGYIFQFDEGVSEGFFSQNILIVLECLT